MGFNRDRVHVWWGEVADRAGGVATLLAHLAQAGANLEFIFTQRQASKPGTGMIYLAPLSGPSQVRAAKSAGLAETYHPVVVRVEGDNQGGVCRRGTPPRASGRVRFQGRSMF